MGSIYIAVKGFELMVLYNSVRFYSSLDYRPPAPEAIMPLHFDPFWLSFSKENIAQALT